MISWYSERSGTVEASEAGLAPGVFPDSLELDGLELQKLRVVEKDGNVQCVVYYANDGHWVEIFND
jgi:hypothetical protein